MGSSMGVLPASCISETTHIIPSLSGVVLQNNYCNRSLFHDSSAYAELSSGLPTIEAMLCACKERSRFSRVPSCGFEGVRSGVSRSPGRTDSHSRAPVANSHLARFRLFVKAELQYVDLTFFVPTHLAVPEHELAPCR